MLYKNLLFIGLVFLSTCAYTTKVTDGKTAVELKQYATAIPMLKKEFNRAKLRSEKGKIARDLALAYANTGQDEEAVVWYGKAYDNGGGTDALKGKAATLKRLERYDEAIEAYTDLGIELGSRYEFRGQITGAEIALGWLAEEHKAYQVARADFNSPQSDYAPVRYSNGQIVITSDRPAATGDATYSWTGRGFTDLFLVDPQSGSIDPFDRQLNTEANEGVPTFSEDYEEMIFVRCNGLKREDAYCGLYISRKQGNAWSVAEKLSFVEPGVNYLHPSLSEDGNILYYSAKTEDGWGGYDIFRVERTLDGVWGEPKMLNRSVNTQGNEQFPFVDGDTLYFASDGHIGMGGLDIYKVYRMQNGRFSPPQNLKPPLNSGADDFGYTILREPAADGIIATGYFTSSRPGGRGSEDIYRYERRPLPPPPPVDETEPIVYRNVLDLYIVEKIYEDPTNPNSRILGRRPIPNATVTIQVAGKQRTVNTNEDGQLSLVLADAADYTFLASEEGYLNEEGRFSSKGLPQDPNAPEQRYDVEILLEKIFPDREIV
ncbi:MAG: flagellar motor protein MotB, partial [Bacteroidota bacterium]